MTTPPWISADRAVAPVSVRDDARQGGESLGAALLGVTPSLVPTAPAQLDEHSIPASLPRLPWRRLVTRVAAGDVDAVATDLWDRLTVFAGRGATSPGSVAALREWRRVTVLDLMTQLIDRAAADYPTTPES
ncbi:hypothetical protein [Auraticoccus monumenti]|uniref:Uncharacterized protein n=1 Tax=Auraticoccus monumenti TaxID=675864 RepID=A0A1G7D2S4_9ACTN|nr:hypothetical protein [Auraticoccus monumenti]SDE45892.1 hypothetical protein SAMN04489747_3472 [Auraticoccus monumenti]